MENKKNDVCLCEPFILPGILPTLGVSTLKSVLLKNGISSTILYSSLIFFIENKLYDNNIFNGILDNTPLQLVEYLFSEDSQEVSKDLIAKEMLLGYKATEIQEELYELQTIAKTYLNKVVNEIIEIDPKVLCYSLTFGDFNYAFLLFKKVKEINPNITIIVGGSSCLPDFSKTLLEQTDSIDYVICDETFDATLYCIKQILNNKKEIFNVNVSSKKEIAKCVNKIVDLNTLPVPNFDDYFKILEELNIDTKRITLPYEMSRGCWWAEKRACTMCGFFGNQHKFLIKKPQKVISEIQYLAEKYKIDKFRFSDLVQPKLEYLEQLSELDNKYKFFWELRPGLSLKEIKKLRKFGLTSAQIGIESFSTDELKLMNKGSVGIENIAMLINFSTYKINIIWNYLYGFEQDKAEWYEDVIKIIPKLFHLQPPSAREIWINKYSELYDKENKESITAIGKAIFHSSIPDEFEFFYKKREKGKLENVYKSLILIVEQWQKNYNKGYELYVDKLEDNQLEIVRNYEVKEIFKLNKIESLIYTYFFQPNTIEKAVEELFLDRNIIKDAINKFLKQNIMIYLDNKYLSLATRDSEYKWIKHNEQVSYMGKYILKGYNGNDL